MKIVLIEWNDSCSHANEWMDVGDKRGMAHCVSVGFLVRRDKEKVAIAQNCHPDENNIHNIFVLPRGCIKKITELK